MIFDLELAYSTRRKYTGKNYEPPWHIVKKVHVSANDVTFVTMLCGARTPEPVRARFPHEHIPTPTKVCETCIEKLVVIQSSPTPTQETEGHSDERPGNTTDDPTAGAVTGQPEEDQGQRLPGPVDADQHQDVPQHAASAS